MAVSVKMDVLGGTAYSADMFNGESYTRVARVTGLSAFTASVRMREAVRAVVAKVGAIGSAGSAHPQIPGIIVRGMDPQVISYDAAFVFVRYARRTQTILELSGSLQQGQTTTDFEGNEILLDYQVGNEAASAYGISEGAVPQQQVAMPKLIPGATATLTTSGATRPDNLIGLWLGKINEGSIKYGDGSAGEIVAADSTWLCTGIRGRQDNPESENGWTRIINFTYRPDTWHGVAIYKLANGVIPLDVDTPTPAPGGGNGVRVSQLYDKRQFDLVTLDASETVIVEEGNNNNVA